MQRFALRILEDGVVTSSVFFLQLCFSSMHWNVNIVHDVCDHRITEHVFEIWSCMLTRDPLEKHVPARCKQQCLGWTHVIKSPETDVNTISWVPTCPKTHDPCNIGSSEPAFIRFAKEKMTQKEHVEHNLAFYYTAFQLLYCTHASICIQSFQHAWPQLLSGRSSHHIGFPSSPLHFHFTHALLFWGQKIVKAGTDKIFKIPLRFVMSDIYCQINALDSLEFNSFFSLLIYCPHNKSKCL